MTIYIHLRTIAHNKKQNNHGKEQPEVITVMGTNLLSLNMTLTYYTYLLNIYELPLRATVPLRHR